MPFHETALSSLMLENMEMRRMEKGVRAEMKDDKIAAYFDSKVWPGVSKKFGHLQGVRNLHDIMLLSFKLGVNSVTETED